jgi:transcription termination factor Rho
MIDLTEIRAKNLEALQEFAQSLELQNGDRVTKEDLLRSIMEELSRTNQLRFENGILEILPDGYGFLRDNDNYLPSRNDIYVSPSQIKRFTLRDGDMISGLIRAPKNDERYFALLKVEEISRSGKGSASPRI